MHRFIRVAYVKIYQMNGFLFVCLFVFWGEEGIYVNLQHNSL